MTSETEGENMSRSTQAARLYFLAQAVAVTVWWIAVSLSPEARSHFFSPVTREWTISGFLVGDLIFVVSGSVFTFFAAKTNMLAAACSAWLTLGAVGYATVMALALNWPLFQRPLSDLGMLAVTLGSLVSARQMVVK